MDSQEILDSPRAARPRRTLFGTALRTLIAGLFASGLTVMAAVVFDRESHSRQFQDRPASPPGASMERATNAKSVGPSVSVAPQSTKRVEQGREPSVDASAGTPMPRVREPVEDVPSPSDAVTRETAPGVEGNEGTPLETPGPGSLDRRPRQPSIAERLERLEDAIVKVESGDEGDLSGLGTGFVIDSRGLVATNYHVVSGATRARARFKNGAAYDVAGYAAIAPDLDLAIVSLEQRPVVLEPLTLRGDGDPPRLSSVVAIGHPQGVEYSPFDGKVSRVLSSSELPETSQRFLRRIISGNVNHRWIQHTATISEGNSGGPLLNERGEVIGINTWVDRQARFGYALHARHLRELLDAVTGEVEPLRKYARKDARVADLLEQLTPARVESLWDEAERRMWRPESEADYEVLQQLAWAVTVVNLPDTLARGRIDDRLDALSRVTDRIVQKLSRKSWDAVGHVTIVNDHALEHLSRPMAGVFVFGVVERTVEGDDGARGALVRVAGSEQMLFLPLDAELTVPPAGLQCLILGVNYDGHRVRYGDNPLKLVTAHVIASRTLLPLAKPSD